MQMYAVVATGLLGLLIGFWLGRSIRWNMEETEEAVNRQEERKITGYSSSDDTVRHKGNGFYAVLFLLSVRCPPMCHRNQRYGLYCVLSCRLRAYALCHCTAYCVLRLDTARQG